MCTTVAVHEEKLFWHVKLLSKNEGHPNEELYNEDIYLEQ